MKKKYKRALKAAALVGAGMGLSKMMNMGMASKDTLPVSGIDSEVGAVASMKKKALPVSGIDSEVGAVASMKEPTKSTIADIAEKAKIRSSRGAGDPQGGIPGGKFSFPSAEEVRARNAAQAARMKEAAKGKQSFKMFQAAGFPGFSKGSKNAVTVMARGCKLGRNKPTKIS